MVILGFSPLYFFLDLNFFIFIWSVCFTGKGAGKIQLVAQQGSLLSETYEVVDAIFYDAAVTGKTSTEWGYNTTDLTPVPDENGTTVTNIGSTGRTYWVNYPGSTKATGDEWNTPLCIEVDILSAGNNVALQLVKGSSAASRNMNQAGLTNGGHLKIVADGSKVYYYANNSSTPFFQQGWTEIDFSIRFYIIANDSFKYKNFMIYPI